MRREAGAAGCVCSASCSSNVDSDAVKDAYRTATENVRGVKRVESHITVLPPEVPLYAVGGANPDNFAEYFAAGCAGFGLGTYIYKPGMSATDVAAKAQAAVTPRAPPVTSAPAGCITSEPAHTATRPASGPL